MNQNLGILIKIVKIHCHHYENPDQVLVMRCRWCCFFRFFTGAFFLVKLSSILHIAAWITFPHVLVVIYIPANTSETQTIFKLFSLLFFVFLLCSIESIFQCHEKCYVTLVYCCYKI